MASGTIGFKSFHGPTPVPFTSLLPIAGHSLLGIVAGIFGNRWSLVTRYSATLPDKEHAHDGATTGTGPADRRFVGPDGARTQLPIILFPPFHHSNTLRHRLTPFIATYHATGRSFTRGYSELGETSSNFTKIVCCALPAPPALVTLLTVFTLAPVRVCEYGDRKCQDHDEASTARRRWQYRSCPIGSRERARSPVALPVSI